MRKFKRTEIIGSILVLVGLLLLGNNYKLWNINIFFEGWWTLFIVIPAIINIFEGENVISSLLIFLVGMILFFLCQGLIAWGIFGKLLVPILFVLFGITLIFKPRSIPKIKKEKTGPTNTNYVGMFRMVSEDVNYEIKNANCVSIFGGVDLDLTKINSKEDIHIEVISIFGSIKIKAPKNMEVRASGSAVFGSSSDNANGKVTKTLGTIHISYTCIFGQIDIE